MSRGIEHGSTPVRRRVVCAVLLGGLTLLSACTTTPSRKAERERPPVFRTDIAPDVQPRVVAEVSSLAPPASTPLKPVASRGQEAGPQDVWSRIRADEESLQCDQLTPRAARWLNYYIQHAKHVQADLERAMPVIQFVDQELKAQRVPALFAMLPMVESRYRIVATTGNRAAGIWQLMPITARGLGVAIGREYDGRLDTVAATRAAARLLAHLAETFDRDWRLMNMAFNAGEFRVKAAIRKHPERAAIPETLELTKITLHHLAKLKALTCFVKDAERHEITLPDPGPHPPLVTVALDQPVELAFLAHVAGTDLKTLRLLNPALRGSHTPSSMAIDVLLPQDQAASARAALARIPVNEWRRWTLVPVSGDDARTRLLTQHAEIAETVNAVNRDPLAARLWLPLADSTSMERQKHLDEEGRHVVIGGDTLWDIARRYRVSLSLLMRWNGLTARSLLKPGDRLRISAPDP